MNFVDQKFDMRGIDEEIKEFTTSCSLSCF